MVPTGTNPSDLSPPAEARTFAGPSRFPLPGRPRNRSQRQIDEGAEIKAMIVAAATTAFAEHGYARTTLDAVAASVGLSRSGVLHHFPSKDALFAAVLDDRARIDAQRLETLESGPDGRGALQRLGALLDLGSDRGADSQLLPVLNAEGLIGNSAARSFARSHLELVRERATSALDRGRRDGSVAPEGTDAADLALLLAAVVDGLHVAKLLEPETDVDAAYDLFLDLVTGQKG